MKINFILLKKILLVISLFLIYLKIILFKDEFNKPLAKYSVNNLLNFNITNNTVLIFEPAEYHHECTPGYTKYFLDLGYNVDIILNNFGSNTFCLFNLLQNIRIFTFDKLSQFTDHSKEFHLIFKNYSYILIETTSPLINQTYNDLGFFKMKNTIFVVHYFEHINSTGISIFNNQNRIWSLGNLKNALYVNPHYYGDIKIRNKNNRTKFFLVSTSERNYKDLIFAAEKLKNENLEFEVIVIGREEAFSSKNISENLKENFKFKYKVKFKELYEAVESSDYIIINLYPNYKNNDLFRRNRLTGSSQLSFGFYKLALIHKSFAGFYNMSSENSFLFDNSNFYEIMSEAILLDAQKYKEIFSLVYSLSFLINSIKNVIGLFPLSPLNLLFILLYSLSKFLIYIEYS